MSAGATASWTGRPRSQREVIDIPEPRKQDKSLDKLIVVRKQRIERLERERVEARLAWRETRQALHDIKQRWRDAVDAAQDFWQESRAGFFKMAITSGQFRRAKAMYERMKGEAEQLHLESREAVVPCKAARSEFFAARRRALDAYRQHEKLGILRDELRLLNAQQEQ
jgi:hypothetical protein